MSHKEVITAHTFQELGRTLASLSFLLFWGIIIVAESQLESKDTKPPRLQRILGITLTRAKKKFRNSSIGRIINFTWRMNKRFVKGSNQPGDNAHPLEKIYLYFIFIYCFWGFIFKFLFYHWNKEKIFFHYTYQSQFSPLPIPSNFPPTPSPSTP